MSLTYSAAVEQTITAGEQIHQIVNGTATTEVTVEDGSKVPSIRKALLDNFYFKDPIAWQVGQTENVFNQLRQFTDGSWWYAPSATASNPISMGSTPVGDPLWKIYDFDAIGKLTPQLREALRRSYAEAGYNLVDGSFEAGGTLVNANDMLLQELTGKAFSGPAGTVAEGTNPASGGFVDRSGVIIRDQIAASYGSSLVGTQITTDSSIRTVAGKLRETVSLLDFHCDASGNPIAPSSSVDVRQMMQNAINYLSLLGGGKLTIPSGEWFLNSYSTDTNVSAHNGVIQFKSNVCIELEPGASIRLGSFFNGKPFKIFVGWDNATPSLSGNLHNVHVFGSGKINLQGITQASGGNLTAIAEFGKSYDCTWTVNCENADITWAVTMGWNGHGHNCHVHHCAFKSLVASTNNADHSTVYMNCPDSTVHDVYFFDTSFRAKEIACAVELHQPGTAMRNCNILGYCRGVYIAAAPSEAIYLTDIAVEGNIAKVGTHFVNLWLDSSTPGSEVSLGGCVISGNTVHILDRGPESPDTGVTSFMLLSMPPASGGVIYAAGVQVYGNTFVCPLSVSIGSSFVMFEKSLYGDVSIRDNYIDAKHLAYSAPAFGSLNINGLHIGLNDIGVLWSGHRSGFSLVEFHCDTIVNSSFEVKLRYADTSMYRLVYFGVGCDVTYSVVKAHHENTSGNVVTVTSETGSQNSASNYFEYPATIPMSRGADNGVAVFNSQAGTYAWVAVAESLSAPKSATCAYPAAYTPDSSGVLRGVGVTTASGAELFDHRVMLKSNA